MKEAGEVITVATSLQEYTDMVIVEVDTECTASNGRSFEGTVTLQHIAFVDSKIVDEPEIPGTEQKQGRKDPKTSTPKQEESVSALFKLGAKAGLLP